jgi:hypothetical protein
MKLRENLSHLRKQRAIHSHKESAVITTAEYINIDNQTCQ